FRPPVRLFPFSIVDIVARWCAMAPPPSTTLLSPQPTDYSAEKNRKPLCGWQFLLYNQAYQWRARILYPGFFGNIFAILLLVETLFFSNCSIARKLPFQIFSHQFPLDTHSLQWYDFYR